MTRFTFVVGVALLVPFAPQERAGVLAKKWEFKIMERVYLADPSGWINHMPWLISSPAIGDLGHGGPELEVVTGTEEGFGEWFPRGANSGRYIGISSKGVKLWDYETKNNAGRASPAMADLDVDGVLECLGGSTSGWQVHAFDNSGTRRWKYDCVNQSNVLGPPASADLTSDAGNETVALALDGHVYCISAAGRQVWSAVPGGSSTRGGQNCAAPAIADLDGDNKLDVIVCVNGLMYCLEGSSGRQKWTADATGCGMSSPAILPKADP